MVEGVISEGLTTAVQPAASAKGSFWLTIRKGKFQGQMIETTQMPSEQMLETLADALTGLEYYLEGGAMMRPEGQPDVLDVASESVKALGLTVAA